MSDIINEMFDISAIEKQKKEAEDLIKEYSDFVKKTMAETRKASTGDDLLKQTKAINDAMVQGTKAVNDYTAVEKELLNQKKQLEAVEAKRYAANSKANQDLEKNKKLLAEQNKELKLQAILNDENAGKLEKARASNALLQIQKEKLKETDENYSKTIDELNKKQEENNAIIASTLNKRQQQTDQVGNYEEAIKNAIKSLMGEAAAQKENIKMLELAAKAEGVSKEEKQKITLALNENRAALALTNKELEKYGQNTEEQSASVGELVEGFKKGEIGAGGLAKGVASAGKQMLIAFVSNPIGIIIAAVAAAVLTLVKAFQRSEESMGKIKQVTGALSGVFGVLMDALKPVVNFIADNLIKTFETLGNVAEKATGLVSKGLKALGFDQAAKNVDNYTQKVKEGAAAGRELAKQQAEQVIAERELATIQKEYLKEQEDFRQIRDNINNSYDVQIKATNDLADSLNEQAAVERKIFDQALKNAELRAKIQGETPENLDAIAAAKANIADLEERINGFQSEQLTSLASIRKAQEDDAAARNQAIIDQQKNTADLIQQADELAKKEEEKFDLFEDMVFEETEAEKKKADYLNELNEAVIQNAIDKKQIEYEQKLVILRKEATSEEDFAQKKFDLDKSLLQAAIDRDTKTLESANISAVKRLEIETQLAQAQIDLDNLVLDNFKGNEEGKLQAFLEVAGEITDAGLGLYQAIADFQAAEAEKRLAELDKQQEKSDELFEKQQANLDKAIMSEASREIAQKKIEDDKKKRDEEILDKKRAEEVRQVKFDKEKALTEAIISTLLATTQALPNFLIAGLVAAAGAYNIARIASQQIPAYADGGVTKGEPFSLWGEAGPEMATTPSGHVYFADKPTLSHFDAGTIITNKVGEYERNMSNTANGSTFEIDYDRMAEAMPNFEVELNGNGSWTAINRRNNRITAINRQYKIGR